jgi:secreted trypsin-like serine protease
MHRTVAGVIVAVVLVAQVMATGYPAATAAAPVVAAVVGGTPVSEGAYPFLALLLRAESGGYGEYCGGSLIAEQWVLTAAHCVTPPAPVKPDVVLIGRMVSTDTGVGDRNNADAVFVDPAYNAATIENDFALLHLSAASPEAEIHLVDESQDLLTGPGAQATVIGAGQTSNDAPSGSSVVEMAPQTVIDDATCANLEGLGFVASSMVCAGQPNVSPCFGDSGGPLFISGPGGPVDFGVVSHGPRTCGSLPGVYSRVSAARTWIREIVATMPAPVGRLSGPDRIGTAIAVSNQAFTASGSAGAVVLANAESYADALAGTPLAVAKHGPLLLTSGKVLDGGVAAEIQRLLPAGATVYLLGGEAALDPALEAQLQTLHYSTTRYGGADRYSTAVMIASSGLGNPTTVLEATGLGFADALAGGAAAAAVQGALLLTDGATQASATSAYLNAHPADKRYALGGPAVGADPGATALAGADRYATAVTVAQTFFHSVTTFGAASGLAFPDALAGGAHMGALSGPMLLVPPAAPLPPSVLGYLTSLPAPVSAVWLYGGNSAVAPDTLGELVQLAS